MTIPTFGYLSLTEAVNKMIRPKRFILSRLFSSVRTHATKAFQVDIIVGKRKIAPFVRRGKEALVMNNLGKKSQIVEPPNIRLKKILTADEMLFTRGAGTSVIVPGGQGDQIQSARKQKVAEEQADLLDTINRTTEYLAAQALKGSYEITGEDVAFGIDFQMPAANKPVLEGAAKWDQKDTATPLANMRTWKQVVAKASGKVITDAVFTTATFNNWLATAEVKEYMDKRNIDIGAVITPQEFLDMGATKVARIDNVDYWVYDEYYEDDNGDLQAMIPDGVVAAFSKNGDYRLHHGAIEDLQAGTTIGKYFSKDWVTEDPSVYNILVESHPLPVPHEPESMIYADVY